MKKPQWVAGRCQHTPRVLNGNDWIGSDRGSPIQSQGRRRALPRGDKRSRARRGISTDTHYSHCVYSPEKIEAQFAPPSGSIPSAPSPSSPSIIAAPWLGDAVGALPLEVVLDVELRVLATVAAPAPQ